MSFVEGTISYCEVFILISLTLPQNKNSISLHYFKDKLPHLTPPRPPLCFQSICIFNQSVCMNIHNWIQTNKRMAVLPYARFIFKTRCIFWESTWAPPSWQKILRRSVLLRLAETVTRTNSKMQVQNICSQLIMPFMHTVPCVPSGCGQAGVPCKTKQHGGTLIFL